MKQRLNNISLLRLLAIILIFIFHILYFSTDIAKQYFPFYFGVQIFLAISGFLYAQKDISNFKKFYKKNFLKIVIPVIFLLLFMIIGNLILNPSYLTFNNLIANISSGKYSFGHLWFVPIILLCYALLPLMQMATDKTHKHHKLALTILTLILLIEAFLVPLCLQVAIFAYVIGFLLGKAYKNKENFDFTKKKWGIIGLSMFCGGGLIYLFSKNNIFDLSHILTYIQSWAIEIQTTIMGIGILLCFLCFFDFLNNKPTPKILKLSDKYGYHFYLFHHIFCTQTLSLLSLTDIIFVNAIIIFVITIICCIVFEYLSTKIIDLINSPHKKTTN